MARRSTKPDPLTAPDIWTAKNAITLGHAIAPLDEVVREMEAKWGIDRLPGLVSPELAAKLGARIEEFERARGAGDVQRVCDLAARLIKGWKHLDQEATRAGCRPISPEAWPITVGETTAMICHAINSRAVHQAHPEATVYTLEEVGRLIEIATLKVAPAIAEVKGIWSEARISDVRPASKPTGELIEDEIPW